MRAGIGPQFWGDVPDRDTIYPPTIRSFYNGSGSTIPAGSCVVVDLSIATTIAPLGCAIKIAPATAGDARKIIGATVEDIPTGAIGKVQMGGIQPNVSVVNGTAVESLLIGSTTTAGRLIIAAFAAGERPVAFLLTAPASNLATVLWLASAM